MRVLPPALLPMLLLAGSAQGEKEFTADSAKVAKDNNAFSCDLYQQLAKKDGNLFFSPYSISTALAMTYAGARGETAAEMARTLHFDLPAAKLHPAFAGLIQETDAKGRKYKLQVANRLWGQKNYGFLPDFLKVTEDNYRASLKEVDFARETEAARRTINAWIEEQTQNKIKEVLKPGVVTPDTRLVLTNAIYFKAAWLHAFEPTSTKDGEFTLASGKTVAAKLMAQHLRGWFGDYGDYQVMQIPYERHELSMLVFLPKKADGLAALERKWDVNLLAKATAGLKEHRVDLKLPRFKLTSQFTLNDQLAAMGMARAFDPAKADFSGMTSRDKLAIGSVIHKAFVDVNEIGTEAAAATVVEVAKEAAGKPQEPPPATFHATRPFLYIIRDDRTGSVLFVGRVAEPMAGP